MSQKEMEFLGGRTFTKEEIYGKLGLLWIPPELRENRREFDWAEAGELPEHPEALPVRVAGWREGMPLPSAQQAAEGGRKAAVTRWGGRKGKGARKGAQKPGKGKAKP